MEVFSELGAGAQLLASVFPLNVTIEPVRNVAVGTEYQIIEHLVLRGGFYTNLSAAPEISIEPTRAYGPDVELFGTTYWKCLSMGRWL